jgi:hypothetical protein
MTVLTFRGALEQALRDGVAQADTLQTTDARVDISQQGFVTVVRDSYEDLLMQAEGTGGTAGDWPDDDVAVVEAHARELWADEYSDHDVPAAEQTPLDAPLTDAEQADIATTLQQWGLTDG